MTISKKLLFHLAGLLLLLTLLVAGFPSSAQQTKILKNDAYTIVLQANSQIEIQANNTHAVQTFSPRFTVVYSATDPKLGHIYNRYVGTKVPSWIPAKTNRRTARFFNTGDTLSLQADHSVLTQNKITWQFGASQGLALQATLTLPAGKAEPVVHYRLRVPKPGWYSVGYTGAPATAQKDIKALWQPFVWQERRFPYVSFLSTEDMCPLPAVLLRSGQGSVGVVADPAEIPFRFSTLHNARFGVLLRDAAGKGRPMLFSPVLGGAGSHLEAGDTVGFRFRIVLSDDSLFDLYRYMARTIFHFRDYRKNATCTLNETLENTIAYAMNDVASGWVAELKGSDYTTDVPGTVKNVSALHPLSIAIITDNQQIYNRRALPMIEYLMSREKYLYSEDTAISGQSPSHYLKGPSANLSELAALYEMTGKRSPVLSHYATQLFSQSRVLNLKKEVKGNTWQNALALYRMTGAQRYLDSAQAGADRYIKRRIATVQTDFSDVQISSGERFPTNWTPQWIDLLELYEATGKQTYLQAAKKGAALFINFIWMVPEVPEGSIVINQGDTVGTYAYQNRLFSEVRPMRAAAQKVAAWRMAQVGLMPESTTTYIENRAIFLTHYAAYLLRLAYYTHSTFFHDIARSAVVGRYANYPGYSIMGEYTTIYSRPDYPLRPITELTYNNIYYNHIWPQIALLMDYLVSDAFTRSAGQINFPSRYAQGYAYLQSKVYGDRKGRFYSDKNVQLWLPANLLTTNTIQANYVAGYGNNKLYIALMNQSPDSMQVSVHLNPDIVPLDAQKEYKVTLWENNHYAGTTTMKAGKITVPLQGRGITALAINDLTILTEFQQRIFGEDQPLPSTSYAVTKTPLGQVHGMILDMGKGLTNAYIYMEATEDRLKSARLHYQDHGEWKDKEDTAYPFEWSLPLSEDDTDFRYWIEGVKTDGSSGQTEEVTLKVR